MAGALFTKEMLLQMKAYANPLMLLGRIGLSLIFVISGIRQLAAIDATAAHMANEGLPLAGILVWGAVAMDLGVGLLLAAGLFTRCAALALCLYTLALALIFHRFWTMTGPAYGKERNDFIQHFAIMGGMLYVMVSGAGAYSLDALRRGKT